MSYNSQDAMEKMFVTHPDMLEFMKKNDGILIDTERRFNLDDICGVEVQKELYADAKNAFLGAVEKKNKHSAKDIEYAAAMTVVEGCLTPWPKFTHHKPERESNTERNRRKKNKKRTNKFNMKHSK